MMKKAMNYISRKIAEAREYRRFKRAIWRSIPALLLVLFGGGGKRKPRKTKILIYLKDMINGCDNTMTIDELEDDGIEVSVREISEDEVPKKLLIL